MISLCKLKSHTDGLWSDYLYIRGCTGPDWCSETIHNLSQRSLRSGDKVSIISVRGAKDVVPSCGTDMMW